MHILVIEDEQKVAQALKEGLEREHYRVSIAHTGEDGFYLLNTQTFDIVVLDLMLPGRDGLEILTTLRKKEIATPVLILTARDAVEDRVLGLDSGADDYLVKPFAFAELLARIRALLRRGRSDQVLRLSLADLEMDLVIRKVTRSAREIVLTTKEFELLEYLLRHKGQVVSREMLAREVWKETQRATPLDNVIDVHIARLRRKIDEPFQKKLLHTLRGVGEVGIQNDNDIAHYREVISSMLEEADRMTQLVESLLLLSRADAGHIQLNRESILLFDLVQESVNLLTVLAEEKKQSISLNGDKQLRVTADRMVLRQALINLIDNAIKYSPKNEQISIHVLRKNANSAIVEIADNGPGIPTEHHDKIFERFYRVDKARSREMGGAGLGLAIARWAAEAHGGRLELESKENQGCVFRLVLFPKTI